MNLKQGIVYVVCTAMLLFTAALACDTIMQEFGYTMLTYFLLIVHLFLFCLGMAFVHALVMCLNEPEQQETSTPIILPPTEEE